jgi:uncharacterized protein
MKDTHHSGSTSAFVTHVSMLKFFIIEHGNENARMVRELTEATGHANCCRYDIVRDRAAVRTGGVLLAKSY